MKNAPELDPELRGLLAEIAADPRSRLRLAPRHALRSWYINGETVRPREIDATVAERHLVAAHREALAALLCEASALAYWLAPETCSRRPQFVIDEQELEHVGALSARISRRAATDPDCPALLAAFTAAPGADQGTRLAEAALALVPASSARLCLAFHLRTSQPRAALRLFRHVGRNSADPDTRARGWSGAGATGVTLGDVGLAYEDYCESLHDSQAALPWAFNLAACRADSANAREHLQRIEESRPSETKLSETVRILEEWLSSPSEATERAREEVRKLHLRGGPASERILNVYA